MSDVMFFFFYMYSVSVLYVSEIQLCFMSGPLFSLISQSYCLDPTKGSLCPVYNFFLIDKWLLWILSTSPLSISTSLYESIFSVPTCILCFYYPRLLGCCLCYVENKTYNNWTVRYASSTQWTVISVFSLICFQPIIFIHDSILVRTWTYLATLLP